MILFTALEAQLLYSAATNAGRFKVMEQAERLTYKVESLAGIVIIDKERGEDLAELAARVHAIHPDTAQVIAWTLDKLIGNPRDTQPKGKTPTATFALSRVASEALGVSIWKVSKAKREELLHRVSEGIWFAKRARVECSRGGTFDMGGEHREALKIAAAPLTGQRLDMEPGGRARIVEVSLSSQWLCPLTGSRAQYLPVGDAFANLSSGRPSGAWARSIALWLVAQCRIHKGDALEGLKATTPGEIIQRFGVGDLPKHRAAGSRTLETWAEALGELANAGLIAPHPDADPAVLRERLGVGPGPNAGRGLLEVSAPPLVPGPVLVAAIEALERTGDPLKVWSSPPKSVETTPEKCRDSRGDCSTNRKQKSTAGVAPKVAPPTAAPLGRRRPRPCPICDGTPPSDLRRPRSGRSTKAKPSRAGNGRARQ